METAKGKTMNLTETLSKLESLGEEKVRAMHLKNGARENIFGVKMGDIRALAKKIKTDHELALQLWETENIDARLLAILIIKPKALSAEIIKKVNHPVTIPRFGEAESLNVAVSAAIFCSELVRVKN